AAQDYSVTLTGPNGPGGPGPGGPGPAEPARAGSGAGQALLLGGDGGDQRVARGHVEQGEQRGDPLAVVLQRRGRGDLRGLRVLYLVAAAHAVGDPGGPGGDGRDLSGGPVGAAALGDHRQRPHRQLHGAVGGDADQVVGQARVAE